MKARGSRTMNGKARAKSPHGTQRRAQAERQMKEIEGVGRMRDRAVPDRATLPLTPSQEAVLAVLTPEPASAAEISRLTGMNAHSVRSVLLHLQGKGKAARRNADSKWGLA